MITPAERRQIEIETLEGLASDVINAVRTPGGPMPDPLVQALKTKQASDMGKLIAAVTREDMVRRLKGKAAEMRNLWGETESREALK